MIQSERQLTIPAMRPHRVPNKGPKPLRVRDKIQKVVRTFERPQSATPAHQQSVGNVQPVVNCNVLMLIQDGPHRQDSLSNALGEGLGRHDAAIDGDDRLPKAGPKLVCIAVRGKHQPVCGDGSCRGNNRP